MILKRTGREVPSNIHNSGSVDTGEAPENQPTDKRFASLP